MNKVFIDTNVWFSSFYGSINAEKLLKAHINKTIQAIISQQVLEELVKNIQAKIPTAITPLQILLQSAAPKIIKNPEKVNPQLLKLINRKDQSIFQAAINSQTDLFITGNLKDFKIKPLKKLFDISVLSPAEAVQHFKL